MTIEEQMERLKEARDEAQRIAAEGNRLEGALANAKKHRDEIEKQCKEKFDCPVNELPKLIRSFEDLAEKELAKAEGILGLREVDTGDSEAVESDHEPEEEPEQEDEDGPLV